MIDLGTPQALIESLLSRENPGRGLLDEMRFEGVYTGNYRDAAANGGGVGFLPLAGYATGDVAGLQPLPRRPLSEWPVLRFSHVGDPGVYIASSLKSWLPMHLAQGGDEARTIKRKKDKILRLAVYLGGDTKITAKAIELLIADKLPEDENSYCKHFEEKNSLLNQYAAARGAAALRAFAKKYPWFLPARYALAAAEKKAQSAFEALVLPIYFGGSRKTARELAAIAIATGRKTFGADPRFAAIEKMAAQKPCGRAWFEAAQKLETQNAEAAYNACHNAAYFIGKETERAPAAVFAAAQRCAVRLKDANLAALYSDFQKEDSKESEAVLAEYAGMAQQQGQTDIAPIAVKPLVIAARQGNVEKIKAALARGIAVNASEAEDKITALHAAAETGRVEAIRFLVKSGADLEKKCRFGAQTPLHLAARAGQTRAVAALLAAGSKMNAQNGRGNSALYNAIEKNRVEVVKLLLSKQAKTTICGYDDAPPLHCAVANGNAAVVRLLIAAGARINAKDNDGKTPLHLVANTTKIEIAQLLVGAGANARAKDQWGETPIDVAKKHKRSAMLRILEAK